MRRQGLYQQGIAVRHDGKYLRPVVAGHLEHVAVLLVGTVRTVHLEVAALVHLNTSSVIAGEGGQAGVVVNTVGQGQPGEKKNSQLTLEQPPCQSLTFSPHFGADKSRN